MCFGENGSDTLREDEQAVLRDAVSEHLPSYGFSLRSNEDSITWAVLEPPPSGLPMPKFTVCRIDPCIMVTVEDRAQRRFSSASTMEDAVAFTCETALSAVLANHNVHPSPELAQ